MRVGTMLWNTCCRSNCCRFRAISNWKKLLDLQFNRAEAIKTHIATTNLTGYLSKFELSVRLFRSDGVQLDSVDTRTLMNSAAQRSILAARPSLQTCIIYRMNPDNSPTSVCATVRIRPLPWLALTFDARFFPAGSGFPELFVSGTARESRWPEAYSLARYNRDAWYSNMAVIRTRLLLANSRRIPVTTSR